MTSLEFVNPPNVHTPVSHYTQVARVGNTLYISGQVATAPDGEVVGSDVRAQARQVYRNLEAIMEHFGGSLRQVARTTIFITHWAYRATVSEVRDEFYPSGPYPASTMVVVESLADPRFMLEIEAIAVLDGPEASSR